MKKNTQPKARVLKGSGTAFGYYLNTYFKCAHGCLYCYGRITNKKQYEDWINPKPRLQVVNDLQKDIALYNGSLVSFKDVFVCSISDPYQPLEQQHRSTRECLKLLIANEIPFTVLTKNASVTQNISLFAGYDKCRVGLSIMTLDDSFRAKLEPYASSIPERIEALKQLKSAGISTYLSLGPIMSCPESDPYEIVDTLKPYVDLFELEMWNPKTKECKEMVKNASGVVYNEQYYIDLFPELISYCETSGVTYCVASHSKTFVDSLRVNYVPPLLVSDKLHPNGYPVGYDEYITR